MNLILSMIIIYKVYQQWMQVILLTIFFIFTNISFLLLL